MGAGLVSGDTPSACCCLTAVACALHSQTCLACKPYLHQCSQLLTCHCALANHISKQYLMTKVKPIHPVSISLCSCKACSTTSILSSQVSGDVGRLAAVLDKPLRPIWLSQESRMWLNEMADHADLPFTPLYLVSASRPQPERQSIGRPLRQLHLLL